MFVAHVFAIGNLWYNNGLTTIFTNGTFLYLTVWSIFNTLVTFGLGVYITLYPSLTSTTNLQIKNKKCSPWKWWVVLYEISFIQNIVVTIFFWGLLSEVLILEPRWWIRFSYEINHSMPLICIFIDHIYNRMPIIGRHMWILLIYSLIYLFVNFIATKSRGKPLYKPITWNSPKGFIVPFVTLIFGVILFLSCKKINQYKI